LLALTSQKSKVSVDILTIGFLGSDLADSICVSQNVWLIKRLFSQQAQIKSEFKDALFYLPSLKHKVNLLNQEFDIAAYIIIYI